jgi:hypothetical protein
MNKPNTTNFCEVDVETSNKIHFGKFFFNKRNKLPILEVITPDGRTFYLSLFRFYRIQVSGSEDGEGDYGSSPVIPFYDKIFADMPISVKTDLIDSFARDALSRFSTYGGQELVIPHIGISSIWHKWLHETVCFCFNTTESNIVTKLFEYNYKELEPNVWVEKTREEKNASLEENG